MSAKLSWSCRRGMRELDLPLLGYLKTHYSTAERPEQAAFEWLLERDDLDIWNFLFREDLSLAPDLEPLIRKLRQSCKPY